MHDYSGCTINNWYVISPVLADGIKRYICRCTSCGSVSIKTIDQIRKNKTGRCTDCPPNYHFVVSGDVAEGTLPNGIHFLIDADDVDRVSQFYWGISKGYIERKNAGLKHIKLHQFLMGFTADDDYVIDHINRNPMDCRKENLRIVTWQQNAMNKSLQKNNKTGYTGVFFDNSKQKYVSKIGLNNKRIKLWSSDDPEPCAQAYNVASEFLFGDFAGHHNPVPEPDLRLRNKILTKLRPYRQEAMGATEHSGLFLCSAQGV